MAQISETANVDGWFRGCTFPTYLILPSLVEGSVKLFWKQHVADLKMWQLVGPCSEPVFLDTSEQIPTASKPKSEMAK